MSDRLTSEAQAQATALIADAEETIEAWYVDAEAEVAAILAKGVALADSIAQLLTEARTERADAARLAREAAEERAAAAAEKAATAAARAVAIREVDDEIVGRRAAADQHLTAECERIRSQAEADADAHRDAARREAAALIAAAERDAIVLRSAEAEYVARQMREADDAAAGVVRQAEEAAARVRREALTESDAVRRAAVVATRRLRHDAEHKLAATVDRLQADDQRRHAEMSRLRAALDRALGSPLAGIDVITEAFVDLARLEDEVLADMDPINPSTRPVDPPPPNVGPTPPYVSSTTPPTDPAPRFEIPDDLSALTGGLDEVTAAPGRPSTGSRWRRWLHRV